MKRSLVSILFAPFCFAAIAAIVTPSSQTKSSAKGATFNVEQDKTPQDKNAEAAKRFVGTWKGKKPDMPTDLPPNMNTDAILIFKIEGDQLKGTVRALGISRRNQEAPQIVRDEYVSLPDLNVEGKTLTWKDKWILPDYEKLTQVTLINDDEILFETVGTASSNTRPTLLKPISYKLKREK
jgi:hypothetical protein